MDITGINFVAVLLAAVAGFAWGALYYTVLGKQWMDAVGTTEEEIKQSRSKAPFIISFVSLIVMACVLSAHLSDHSPEDATLGHAVLTAVLLWLGFIVTSMAVNHSFQGCKPKLTILDSVHWLGVLVLQGLIIHAM